MDEHVALFVATTGCPPEQAQFFLQSAGGNLELAVNEFFLSQEEGAGPMDEGSDGGDEGEDGYDDDDAEMNMPPIIPVSPSAPAALPPPSKRPKVEMRQARCSRAPSHASRRRSTAASLCLAGAEPPRRIGGAAGAAAAGLRPRRQAQRRRRYQRVESAAWRVTGRHPCLLGWAPLALGGAPHSEGAAAPLRAQRVIRGTGTNCGS